MAVPPSGAVTILATDLVHSVGLWDEDEEAMSVALARHDQMLREVVVQHRGHVIKGTGDGLWAAFEWPRAALDAAVDMQNILRTTTWGPIGELRVRVVVHTGDAEWRDGDVFGATANRVARMLELVDGGQIFVSETTIRLAGIDESAPFGLRNLGPRQLRGLRHPLHIFELVLGDGAADVTADGNDVQLASLAWKSDRSRPRERVFEPSYPFPTPELLVGRQGDLLTVKRALERGRHEGRTILIGAPAGTGKSTLSGMFVNQARTMGFLCLAGGSFDQENATPYGPIRDALSDYLLAISPKHVRASFADLAEDLESIVPELRYHVGRAGTPEGSPPDAGRLPAAVHSFLRILAAQQPLLLCLEDLHASDDATLQMVHFLARQIRRLPVLLVATYRSEEVSTKRPLDRLISSLKRQALVQEIELRPLDRQETSILLSSLLDGLVSDGLTDALFGATEGNPLFIEQLILALREEHRIDLRDGVWHLTSSHTTPVTPLVQSVIERRFDHLPPSGRDVLAMAAVLGQTFDLPTLAAALGIEDQRAVIGVLDRAIEAQLVHETTTGYRFGHAMIRAALYGSVTGPRRAMLHAQAGEAIERLAGDRASERAADLALHFSLAGSVVPTVAKAVQYSLEAGRRAAALASHREALDHFIAASKLMDAAPGTTLETRLQILLGRALAEVELGLWLPCIATCRSLLAQTSNLVLRARIRAMLSRALRSLGDTAPALVEAETGLAELESAGDEPDVARARVRLLYDRSYMMFLKGQFRTAYAIGQEALARGRLLGGADDIGVPINALILASMGLNQVDLALKHCDEALAVARSANHRVLEAVIHDNAGQVLYRAGRFDEATTRLRRAIELYGPTAGDLRAVNTIQILGRVMLAQGQVDDARKQAELALAHATEGHDRWVAQCHDLLGRISLLSGSWLTAIVSFEHALSVHERAGSQTGTAGCLVGLGLVSEQQGDWQHAERLYRRALTVADQADTCPEQIGPRRVLGLLLVRRGDVQAGLDLLEQARTLAASMMPTIEQAATLVAVAEAHALAGGEYELSLIEDALSAPGPASVVAEAHVLAARAHLAATRPDQARQHASTAIALATGLGATPLIGRAQMTMGCAWAHAGDRPSATAAFDAAMRALERVQAPYDLAVAMREYGRMLAGGEDTTRGRALLDAARHRFTRLEAVRDAEGCEPNSRQSRR